MSKFKNGDKVKIVSFRNKFDHNIEFVSETKVGDIITLQRKFEENGRNFWYFEEGRQFIREDDLEPVNETPEYSCIRVVPPSKPKREIVEGTIILDQFAEIKVMKKDCDASDVQLLIQECPFFTAKALREAAALFTTLAEILEENAK